MDVASVFLELYGRIPPLARHAVEGVELAGLTEPPAPGANPIAWLVWHLARIQDHHVTEVLGAEQIWIAEDWAPRFGLDPDPANTGFGHSAREAVDARTRSMLRELTPPDLDRIVDRRWDPPVTLGVRLVSVADDALQHAGQAAYVRGLLGL
jgi:Protein of unknown function (DUF664)